MGSSEALSRPETAASTLQQRALNTDEDTSLVTLFANNLKFSSLLHYLDTCLKEEFKIRMDY